MAKFTEEQMNHIKYRTEEILEKYESSKWAGDKSFMAQWFKGEGIDGIQQSYYNSMKKYSYNIDAYQEALDSGKQDLEVEEFTYDKKTGEEKYVKRLANAKVAADRLKENEDKYNYLKDDMVQDLFAVAAAYKKKLDSRTFWDKFVGFFTGRNSDQATKYDELKSAIAKYADPSINIEEVINDINKPEPEEVEEAEDTKEVSADKQIEEATQEEQTDLENQLKKNTDERLFEESKDEEDLCMVEEVSIDIDTKQK